MIKIIETNSPGSKIYLDSIDEYNTVLEDLLDRNEIAEPLHNNLRLDYVELSKKYVSWEADWYNKNTSSIYQVINSVESIGVINIVSVKDSLIKAKRIKTLKGNMPEVFELLTILPWGRSYKDWFKEGENSLIFFKEKLVPWTSLCRTPIKNFRGKEFVFFIHPFGAIFTFPPSLTAIKTNFEDMESTAVTLSDFESLIAAIAI